MHWHRAYSNWLRTLHHLSSKRQITLCKSSLQSANHCTALKALIIAFLSKKQDRDCFEALVSYKKVSLHFQYPSRICIYALIGTHSLLSLQIASRSIQCSRHSSRGGCAYLQSKSTCLRAIMGTVGVSLFATFTQSIHGKPYLQFQCQSIYASNK